MVDRSFTGVFPILQMPFDADGQILFDDLRSEVEYAISGGVHGVGLAYGSEINKLDDHERGVALSAVVDQARGRIKVVMNTGAPSTFHRPDDPLHADRKRSWRWRRHDRSAADCRHTGCAGAAALHRGC